MGSKMLPIFLVVVLVVVPLFAACAAPLPEEEAPPAPEVIELKFADMFPPGSMIVKAGEWWASEVERRTEGHVEVKRFWAGSLVGGFEQLDAVSTGSIDVTSYLSGYHPQKCAIATVGVLPFINADPFSETLKAADEWGTTDAALQAELEGNNLKYMYAFPMPNLFLWSKVPIESIDDLEGLRVRTLSADLSTLFEALGCGTVSLTVPEVYDALERGVVDCTLQYLSNAVGGRYYEVVEYVNVTEFGHNHGCPIVMNLDTWNNLPPEIRTIIDEVNDDMIETSIRLNDEVYDKYMGIVRDAGLIIQEFSPSDVEKLHEIAKAVTWEPYAEKGTDRAQALEHYLELRGKYSGG